MTKVKCDVQISVTGPVASGKTLIATRILTAIQSYQDLAAICKVFPSRSFEGINLDMTGLRFEGELPQATITEDDGDKLVEARELLHTASIRLATYIGSEEDPRKQIIDFLARTEPKTATGITWNEPERAPHSDDATKPVGSHQQSENAAPTMDSGPSGGTVQVGHGVQAIYTEGHKKFERLPGETNSEYHARYRDYYAIKKARKTLALVQGSVSAKFERHQLVEGSVLRGDYWVIFNDGALVPLTNWKYNNYGAMDDYPVFYAERNDVVILDHVGNQDAASPAKDAHITDDPLHAVMVRLASYPEQIKGQFRANMGEFPHKEIRRLQRIECILKDGHTSEAVADRFNWNLDSQNPPIFYRVI